MSNLIRNIKILIFALISLNFVSSYSQLMTAQQFGKNKVQYRNFDWKFIQSANFDVYYDAGHKYLAEFTALSAEKAVASIQRTVNFRLTGRVSIVVYAAHNEFQQTNVISSFMPEGVGGVTELFKNRVVVPFQGDYAQLDHVIHHELVHAVLNDMFYGGTFQSAITSSSGFMIPLWLNEGLAEWESIGGMNTETDMFMRDLLLSEKLPPLDRLNGFLAYRGGQTFYWYVADKYGKEKVGDFVNKLKIHRNLNIAFESAFQMDLESFSEKWERDLKRYYWPDLEVFADLKDFATPITDHYKDRTYYNSSPAISPDGEKIAFISAPGGTFGIFVRNIDDKNSTRQLVSSFRKQDFEDLNMLTPGISWDPTGKKIAISAKSGGEDAIFIVDAETGKYDKLVPGIISISSVDWSNSGNEIAFIGTEVNRSDIYIYNLKTKKLTNITNDIFSDKFLRWSSDDSKIFFGSDRSTNLTPVLESFKMWNYDVYQTDLYEFNLADASIRRLTFDSDNDKSSVTPVHGQDKILFSSDKNGISNVYVLDLNTLESRPITNSINAITQIALSKDATKLLFTTQVNGGYDIYMMRFPLEKKLDFDELPMTKFKQGERDKQKLIDNIASENKKSEEEKLVGYGDFEIGFEQQKLVSPNIDAMVRRDESIKNSSVVEISDFQENDYKVSFSADLVMGNPGYSTYYGAQGVTQMLFSDILGDHQIFFQANILMDLRNSQFYLAYNYLPNVIDYQISAYHTSAFVLRTDNYYHRYRNFGTGLKASYPLTMFQRFELGTNFMFLTRENVEVPQFPSDERFLVVPNVRFIHDNTLWGYYGPRDGSRFFVDVTASPKLSETSGVGFLTFSADYRIYFPMGDWISIAARTAGAASFGPDPINFYMGGTDNWINRRFKNGRLPFDSPQDFAFMGFQTPLRGWQVAELTGNKYFLSNFELRFPLLTALVAGPLPILISGINGALFFDIGGAWNHDFVSARKDENGNLQPVNLLMSTGIGIRSYFLGIPWKVDIAWRNNYTAWSEPHYLISMGLDF